MRRLLARGADAAYTDEAEGWAGATPLINAATAGSRYHAASPPSPPRAALHAAPGERLARAVGRAMR